MLPVHHKGVKESVTVNPDSTFGLFSARAAQLAPVSDRQAAFLACWSIVHGFASLLVSRRVRRPPPDPLQMTQRLGEMILDGINVRPETPRTNELLHAASTNGGPKE
jgi:hypothetical protein